jgi:hypothetical protein
MAIKVTGDHIDHDDRAPTVLTIAGGANQAFNLVFGLPDDAGRADIERLRTQPGFREISTVAVRPTATQLEATRAKVADLRARGVINDDQARRIVTNDAAGRETFSLFVSDGNARLPDRMDDAR